MGSLFDSFKRFGAILVVLVLIVMMGLVFSSQPIDEITRTITGDFSVGEFAGDPISRKDYAFYKDSCRSWMAEQKFGALEHFLKYCINTRIRQAYTLAHIAKKLGLQTSAELSKRRLWEEAQTQYEEQTELSEEDRLSVSEIYRFNLSSFPLDIRIRQSSAQEAYQILNLDFPELSQKEKWEKASQKTTLNLRLVYFDDNTMIDVLKKTINPPEAEVIRLFREEQRDRHKTLPKNKGQKPLKMETQPSPAQRKNINERLKSAKAKKELDLIKNKIKHILARSAQINKKVSLEKIAKLTGLKILSLAQVKLSELGHVKAGKDIFNLTQKEFLEKIKRTELNKGAFGPIESSSHTLYAEITKIDFPGLPPPLLHAKNKKKALAGVNEDRDKKARESYDKKTDDSLTRKFFDYVIDKEASRAAFSVQEPES